MKLSTKTTRSWAAMIANAMTTTSAVTLATRLAKNLSRSPRSAVEFRILFARARPRAETPPGLRFGISPGGGAGRGKNLGNAGRHARAFTQSGWEKTHANAPRRGVWRAPTP